MSRKATLLLFAHVLLMLVPGSALAVRLDLTRNQLKGSVNAPMTETAGQAVLLADGAQFDLLGGEILCGRNTTAGALSVTLKAVADDQGRTVDLVESVAAAAFFCVGPLQQSGWRQTTGKAHIDVSADGFTMFLLTPR